MSAREQRPAAGDGGESVVRAPAAQVAGLVAGKAAVDGSHLTVHVLVNPVYNVVMGLNPAWLSTAVFVQRSWGAVLDPMVGQFSDNLRSRWGRRLPLLAASAGPLALLFAALWWFPRQATDAWLFSYFVIVSLAFYAAHSLFAMPLHALMLESAAGYHERTRIAAVFQGSGFAIQLAMQWVFPLMQVTERTDPISALRWVTAGVAALLLGLALVPLCTCREHAYARVAARQPSVPFLPSLRSAVRNRYFACLLGARLVQGFTYNTVGLLSFYLNVYYVYGGDVRKSALTVGILGSAYHAAATFGSLVLFPRLARRFERKRVFQAGAGVLVAGCVAKLFVYDPVHPWWQIVVIGANGLSAAGMGLAALAMVGDIAEQEERRTGLRREGLFAAVLSWTEKAGFSAGAFLGGFILVGIGFDAKRGAQSAETLEWMKLSYFLLPLVGAVIAMLVIDGCKAGVPTGGTPREPPTQNARPRERTGA